MEDGGMEAVDRRLLWEVSILGCVGSRQNSVCSGFVVETLSRER